MSFIYPRTITVLRLRGDIGATPGFQDSYQAPDPRTEVTIFADLPASIQFKSFAKATGAELPADTQNRTNWDIYMRAGTAPKGSILNRDIITDDEGNRYQVTAAYPHPMGHKLRCERLEA